MTEFLTYKDKPLVRSKNVIYYGDMADKFVIKLEILTSHKEDSVEVADKIKVMLIKNNAERAGYYAAKTLRKVQHKIGFPDRVR